MDKMYKDATVNSKGFIIQINSDVYMDIKNICLDEKAVTLFRPYQLLYLMVLNMDKSNIVKMDQGMQEFLVEKTKFSRARLFKVLKAMTHSGLAKKEDKRGYYKIVGIKNKRTI